jgi:hypothetical protein
LPRPPWCLLTPPPCPLSRRWAPSPSCSPQCIRQRSEELGSGRQKPAVEVYCPQETLKLLQVARVWVGQDAVHFLLGGRRRRPTACTPRKQIPARRTRTTLHS